MPTAEQFEEAKVRFFVLADDTEVLLKPTRRSMGSDVLTGGKLTQDVNGFVDATGQRLNSVADSLRDLARECRKRAEECRQAAAAQAAFQAANADYAEAQTLHETRTEAFTADANAGDPGPPPTAPTPPPDPPPYVDI